MSRWITLTGYHRWCTGASLRTLMALRDARRTIGYLAWVAPRTGRSKTILIYDGNERDPSARFSRDGHESVVGRRSANRPAQ